MYLGIDPGRQKFGWALAEENGVFCASGIVPTESLEPFAQAVVEKLKGFDDLGSSKVIIQIKDVDGMPLVTLHGNGVLPRAFEHAISVALTNMSFKYPGIGFMAIGDGGWKLLMPNDMRIPAEGDFGLK